MRSWRSRFRPSSPRCCRAAITHVDVSGVVASVTVVEENYYGLDYVIYFTLVRYGAEWALVTKSYSQIPPQ